MTALNELIRLVRTKNLSPVELVENSLRRIEDGNRVLNAVVLIDGDRAMETARRQADLIARGDDAGPLGGIPIAVKDTEDVAGLRTTHGDPVRADAAVAGADSRQVARLRAAGAIVVGKTNAPAYAMSATTENRLFGATANPHAPDRTSGGSSGGSAAAVASGMVPLATGSDAGGSIRIPAACCGLAGFKPTPGVVPVDDLTGPAGWGAFDGRGLLAATFPDLAIGLDVVAGPSPGDIFGVSLDGTFERAVSMTGSLRGLRVAWSATLGYAEPDPAVLGPAAAAMHAVESMGGEVEVLDGPFSHDPVHHWYVLAALGVLGQIDPSGAELSERLSPDLVATVEYARTVSALELLRAQQACYAVAAELASVWERGYDLLACPVTVTPAPLLGHADNWVRHTYPFNMAGVPAASIPAGTVEVDGDQVPVGVQLVGPRLADRLVFATAARLTESIGAARFTPSL